MVWFSGIEPVYVHEIDLLQHSVRTYISAMVCFPGIEPMYVHEIDLLQLSVCTYTSGK